MKLARDRAFDNEEHKEIVSELEQEEIAAGHYRESSRALIGQ